MYCTKAFTATHGTTTTLRLHLENKHPNKLTKPDGVKSLNR
jgi:hypothetical protein